MQVVRAEGGAPVNRVGLAARGRAVWRLLRLVVYLVGVAWAMRWRFVDQPQAVRDADVRRWSLGVLRCLGIALTVHGEPRPGAKLVVANHVSWLDIMAINAVAPSRFVSKAEVGRWPLVGPMVTLAGTIYLERARRRDAMRVMGLLTESLRQGRTAAVFPEGTTGDGRRLLPFHANLLQSAIDADVPVQPVALRYGDAAHRVSPAALYVGDTTLVQSLWWVACAQGLSVTVTVLPAQRATHSDRRALAARLNQDISAALDGTPPIP